MKHRLLPLDLLVRTFLLGATLLGLAAARLPAQAPAPPDPGPVRNAIVFTMTISGSGSDPAPAGNTGISAAAQNWTFERTISGWFEVNVTRRREGMSAADIAAVEAVQKQFGPGLPFPKMKPGVRELIEFSRKRNGRHQIVGRVADRVQNFERWYGEGGSTADYTARESADWTGAIVPADTGVVLDATNKTWVRMFDPQMMVGNYRPMMDYRAEATFKPGSLGGFGEPWTYTTDNPSLKLAGEKKQIMTRYNPGESGFTAVFPDAVSLDVPATFDDTVAAGRVEYEVPRPEYARGTWNKMHYSVSWSARTELLEAEVEVTIAGYAQWRPKGPIMDPTKPGNSLVARATLVPKGGRRVQDLPKVKTIRFELLDTSREPGVCLNWPLDAKDNDFDLRLAETPKFAAQLSDKDQKNKISQTSKDDQGRPYAETQIDSYDFGGRASLQVVCELADGREIMGVMKGEGGDQYLVRLPKRKGQDWIAESWRKEKKVETLAASADDDNLPVGDGTKGDGFTLYEEYRGWVERLEHIEGDPRTKDLFIQQKNEGIALPGIALFQRITGLNLHYKCTEQEFPYSRIMNANRDLGPNVTDQHGVIVQIVANQLGVSRAVGGPGNPKMISSIDLMTDIAAYDVKWVAATVAHELGHCVNLWHHGDGDQRVIWAAVDSKLYEGRADGTVSGEIFVINEELDNLTPAFIILAKGAQARPPPNNRLVVKMGRDQGQHSGVENCIMRYDDSSTFVYRDGPEFRFANFVEPVGYKLCTTTEGSGVNDKDRKKMQSRYGPALAGRGDCLHQLLVTDAVKAPRRLIPPQNQKP